MLTDEQLFLATLSELRDTIKAPTDARIIKSTNSLRQLVLGEENSLLHRVNKRYMEQIQFKITDTVDIPLPVSIIGKMVFHLKSLGGGGNKIPFRYVDLDDFLSHHIASWQSHNFTVKNIILVAAHVMGGVHNPKEDQQALVEVFKSMHMSGNPMVHDTLALITGKVVEALEPLRRKVKGNNPISQHTV